MDTTAQPEQPAAPAEEVEDESTCRFPNCTRPREPKAPGKPGGAPKYCDDPDHNPMTALRARRRSAAKPAVQVPAELQDRPVAAAEHVARSLRQEVVDAVDNAVDRLAALVSELRTMNDPEAAAAQTYTVTTEAATEVARAQQVAARATAQLLQLQAENRTLLRATEEAGEAAELAMVTLDQRTTEFTTAHEELKVSTAVKVQEAEDKAAERITAVEVEAGRQVLDAQQKAERQVAELTAQLEKFKEETAKEREAESQAARRAVEEARREADRAVKEAQGKQQTAEAATAQAQKDSAAAEAKRTEAEERATKAEMERGIASARLEEKTGALQTLTTTLTAVQESAKTASETAREHQRRLQDELDKAKAAAEKAAKTAAAEISKLQSEVEKLRGKR